MGTKIGTAEVREDLPILREVRVAEDAKIGTAEDAVLLVRRRRCEMGSKEKPGVFDCYTNAEPDEPMFILLARDKDAPGIVEQWARWREKAINDGKKPESDRAMVAEARECATAMVVWRQSRDGVPACSCCGKVEWPRRPVEYKGEPGYICSLCN